MVIFSLFCGNLFFLNYRDTLKSRENTQPAGDSVVTSAPPMHTPSLTSYRSGSTKVRHVTSYTQGVKNDSEKPDLFFPSGCNTLPLVFSNFSLIIWYFSFGILVFCSDLHALVCFHFRAVGNVNSSWRLIKDPSIHPSLPLSLSSSSALPRPPRTRSRRTPST